MFSPVIKAQQPAGVNGTKLWYVSQKNGAQHVLRDLSGNKRPDFNNSTGSSVNLNINFHPSVFFKSGLINIFQPLKNLAFNQGTFIGIYYPDARNPSSNTNKKIVQIDFEKNKIAFKNNAVDTNEIKKYSYGNALQRTTLELGQGTNTVVERGMKTAVYYNASSRNYYDIWGEDKITSISSAFTGYIPEFIYYNRVISPLDRWKIESYLAIKYGITLDTSVVGSTGKVLWDINDAGIKKFHNRVVAIGKDISAGLNQLKSNTTYEELYDGSSAYEFDANGEGNNDSNMVPKNERTSTQRSLTIGFADTATTLIAERKFIFMGDDDKPPELNVAEFDAINYPGMIAVKRRWMLFNEYNIPNALKIELSGLLFKNIYRSYDYLKYRYVMIGLEPVNNTISTVKLFDYIGREVFRDENNLMNFKNNKIVWKNFDPGNSIGTNRQIFTFGQVPLLRFHQVNNQRVKINNKLLAVFVKTGIPIISELVPDTITEEFKTDIEAKLKLRFTKGIAPYRLLVEKLIPGGFQTIKDFTIKKSDLTGNPLTIENIAGNVEENNNVHSPSNTVSPVSVGNVTFYDFSINDGLEVNNSYRITISDKVNQKEVLSVKIKKRL